MLRAGLFLDEIENMPFSAQIKILGVVFILNNQNRGNKPVPIDIRVIAASKDLKEEIEKGNFREDLYYRINVVQLDIPPLRAESRISGVFDISSRRFRKRPA